MSNKNFTEFPWGVSLYRQDGKHRLFPSFEITRIVIPYIAQKMKFSIKDFSCKCDQIHSFMRIWSHLLEKSLIENIVSIRKCRFENVSRRNFVKSPVK